MAMFCKNCGTSLSDGVNFCSSCGTPTGLAAVLPRSGPVYAVPPISSPLMRVRQARQLAGVCAGFARSYGWDLTLVRILMIVAGILIFPIPEIAYLVCWIAMPEEALALPQSVTYPPAGS